MNPKYLCDYVNICVLQWSCATPMKESLDPQKGHEPQVESSYLERWYVHFLLMLFLLILPIPVSSLAH